jgi:hypothetical protein
MLGYDPTRRSYATDRSLSGKTDGTGHVMRHPRHHYHVPAFNALASVKGATCRALGHSVTVWAWTIKGWIDDGNRQNLLGKFNPRLE